jgi:predicted phage-related endonuclease
VDTHLKRAFRLHRDPELEAMLMDAADRFWHQHVLADIPPEPDGTEPYRKFLANRFKTHGDQFVETTERVDLATEALIAIKREQKRLEKDRELAEQVIKTHIGNNLGVRTKFGNVTWRSQSSGRLREKDARKELYTALGWTDDEIEAFEARHAQPDHRVLRTPT